MKYAWMDAQIKAHALTEMCTALDVSISGYRAWKRGGCADRKRLTNAQMLAVIRAIHVELKGAYGSPRMVRELRKRGFTAGKERVERLMRENGIRARHKRRFKVTTDSKHGLPVAANLLDRNFTPAAPNQVWTSDITYLWTDEGWLYLAIVLDLFNREVIGWSLKPRMTTDIVTDGECQIFCVQGPRRLFHGAARRSLSRARACGAVVKSDLILPHDAFKAVFIKYGELVHCGFPVVRSATPIGGDIAQG